MELYPLRSKLVKEGDSLAASVSRAIETSNRKVRTGDIIAVASKVVSVSEGRILPLSTVRPSSYSLRLGKQYALAPQFAEVVINEADQIYGGVKGALLTLKDGQATANAGVDQKNSPDNSVVLWPTNAGKSALQLQRSIGERTGAKIGVMIIDSRVTPLRLGTIGLPLATVGFKSVRDFRGKHDLYNRRIRITLQSVGDGIAAAAHLLMGESREQVPFVLVRDAPVEVDGTRGINQKMRVEDCLYMSQIQAYPRN